MKLFKELQRRNVIRVAVAYGAFAWLLIQVVETVLPFFGISDQAIRVIFIVLAIGFVPSLVFAWVFEMTPEGLKRESSIDRTVSITPHTGKKLDRAIMVCLGLALTYFALDKFVFDPARDAERLESARNEAMEQGRSEALRTDTPDNSIAVLPFLNMSNDRDNEYFSDGVSEELLNLLAQAGGLVVASRTSSFFFKGKDVDIPQVAERLNVRHVLEGSVRKAGNTVRVTAQLIDVGTDSHLWSQTYDRQLDDIFAVQDEIAHQIVSELRIKLGEGLKIGEPAGLSQTQNVEAYQLYLRGLSLLRLRGIDNLRQSATLFEQAIELDPDYARAWAQLAVAQQLIPFYSSESKPVWLGRAEQTARRAIELDPRIAAPHATLGGVYQNTPGTPPALADAEYQRAIELEPGYVTARQWYGEFLMTVGRVKELLAQIREAHRLDPLSPVVNAALAWAYLYNGDYAQAERFALTAIELGMGGTWAQDVLGLVYIHNRDYDKALDIFSGDHPDFALNRLVIHAIMDPSKLPEVIEAIEAVDNFRISYWSIELVMLAGETDLALDLALEQVASHEADARVLWRPHFVKHIADPRFMRMLHDLELLEYWQATGWSDFCRPVGDAFSCDVAYYSEP